jgi:hypothetical protein
MRTPQDIRSQPLAIKAIPKDNNTKEIIDLQQKFNELSVQLANVRDKRPKATNQRTNVWCTNCGGHGHLPSKCSSAITNKRKKCSYCGGRGHDITTCWNILEVRTVVIDNNNQSWPKKNVNKTPYNVTSKRPFTRPNNQPPVWNGPPTNPATHNYGPPKRGKHIVCFNCGELGHYRNDCPNPRKQEGYTPICGRCHESGHISTYCTAIITEFPSSERDYPPKKQVQISENVNHITQMLNSNPIYLTRSHAQKALLQNNQENNSDSTTSTPLVRNIVKSVKKSSSKEPLIDKSLGSIPLIPPNISVETLPSMSIQPSLIPKPIEPPITQVPINETTTNPLREETSIPLKPPLETPTFYRVPRKVLKEPISPVKKRKHNRIMKLAVGMDPYDILNNMDNIQPQISLRQLLAIAPKCRSELSSSLVRKRAKTVDVNDISLDPGAPVVDVIIDGSLINRV